MGKVSEYNREPALADSDVVYRSRATNPKSTGMTIAQLRRHVRKSAGTWDMTGTLIPAAPSGVHNAAVNAGAPGFYELTPEQNLAAPVFCTTASSIVERPASGSRSGTLVMPAETAGDTWHSVVALVATKDVVASTPLLSVTHAISVMVVAPSMRATIDDNHAQVFVMTQEGLETTPFSFTDGAPVAGDLIHWTLDLETGNLSVQINNGMLQQVYTNFPLTPFGSQARILTTVYFPAGQSAFGAGTLGFSFGDWQSVSDATLPAGAADGMVYEVSAAGTFGGVLVRAGDIVELFDGETRVRVIPGPASLDAAAEAAAPTVLQRAQISLTIVDIASAPGAGIYPIGYAVMIYNGSGDFATYSNGDLAAFTGTGWSRVSRSEIQGQPFRLLPANSALGRDDIIAIQSPLIAESSLRSGTGGAFGTANVSEEDLCDLGWILRVTNSPILVKKAGGALNAIAPEVVAIDGAQIITFEAVGGSAVAPLLLDIGLEFGNGSITDAQVIVVAMNLSASPSYVKESQGNKIWMLAENESRAWVVTRASDTLFWEERPRPAKWTEITNVELSNSWVNIGGSDIPFQYRRHCGTAEIRGAVVGGTAADIWGLPPGLRPPKDIRLPCLVETAAGAAVLGQLQARADGTLRLLHPDTLSGHKVWLNVSYDCDIN